MSVSDFKRSTKRGTAKFLIFVLGLLLAPMWLAERLLGDESANRIVQIESEVTDLQLAAPRARGLFAVFSTLTVQVAAVPDIGAVLLNGDRIKVGMFLHVSDVPKLKF